MFTLVLSPHRRNHLVMGPRTRNGKAKSSNKKDSDKDKTWRYDGNYSTIETFKEKVLQDVEYATDLGVALLKGVILVNIISTAAKWFTKQLVPVMGKAQHAKYIISQMNTDITPILKTELTSAIDKSTIEIITKRLREMKTNATEDEIRNEIDKILTNASGGVHFKNPTPKRKGMSTPKKPTLTKTRDDFINLICENEPQEILETRYELGKYMS